MEQRFSDWPEEGRLVQMQRVNPDIGIGAEGADMFFLTADDIIPHRDCFSRRTAAEAVVADNPADEAHFTGRDQPLIADIIFSFNRDIQPQRVGKDRTA